MSRRSMSYEPKISIRTTEAAQRIYVNKVFLKAFAVRQIRFECQHSNTFEVPFAGR